MSLSWKFSTLSKIGGLPVVLVKSGLLLNVCHSTQWRTPENTKIQRPYLIV